jgi:hypothetical protein
MQVPNRINKRLVAVLGGVVLIPWLYTAATTSGLRRLTDDRYTTSGTFIPNGVFPTTTFQLAEDSNQVCLGSWAGSDANTGTFHSSPFSAPQRLSVLLAGRPSTPGIRLYLFDSQRHSELPLRVTYDPSELWRRFTWTLPEAWRGQQVQLVAEDQSTEAGGWIGVSLPESGERNNYWFSLVHALSLQAGMLAEAVLFLLPGVALALVLRRRFLLDFVRTTSLILLGSAAVAYLFFWAYFVHTGAGKLLLAAVVCGSVFTVVRSLRIRADVSVFRETAYCLALTFLIAGFYMGCDDAVQLGAIPEVQAQNRVVPWHLPSDNLLPYIFAEKLYQHEPVRPSLVDGWQGSDRPPLQTGAALMQFPVWFLPKTLHYHLLATFLQALWVPAIWVFLRRAGLRLGAILAVLAFCTFSGFFFIHTIYVWPKLLASALALLGLAFSPLAAREKYSPLDGMLLGAGVALGALAHTGVLLTMFGCAVLFLLPQCRPSRRTLLVASAAFLLLWAPWMAYQKLYDPPGDALVKLHIAGQVNPNRGFVELLRDSYSRLPLSKIIHYKLENFRVLFLHERTAFSGSLVYGFLSETFFSTFAALALLNIGLALLVWHGFRRGEAAESPEFAVASRIGLTALFSTVIWCFMMFGPGTAVTHQGSLLNVVLFSAAGALGLIALAPGLSEFALIISALLVFPVFLIGKWLTLGDPSAAWSHAVDSGSTVTAVLLLIVLIWCVFHALSEPEGVEETGGAPAANAVGNS